MTEITGDTCHLISGTLDIIIAVIVHFVAPHLSYQESERQLHI